MSDFKALCLKVHFESSCLFKLQVVVWAIDSLENQSENGQGTKAPSPHLEDKTESQRWDLRRSSIGSALVNNAQHACVYQHTAHRRKGVCVF